jgi:hypothetical protein
LSSVAGRTSGCALTLTVNVDPGTTASGAPTPTVSVVARVTVPAIAVGIEHVTGTTWSSACATPPVATIAPAAATVALTKTALTTLRPCPRILIPPRI